MVAEQMMKKIPLIVGMVFLALAAVVFIFAGGLRRVYSGILFTLIGVLSVVNAMRKS
jgi:hypothetical protein